MDTTIKNTQKRNKQRGQGLIEYIILVAIIGVATIGVVRSLGHATSIQLAKVTRSLQGKSSSDIKHSEVSESLYSKKDLSNFTRNTSRNNNQ